MKKTITTMIAAGLVAGVAMAEVGVTLDFASAYVFRGSTFNDGAVFQPGIEASGFELPEEYGAVALGAWANYDIDDYDGAVPGSTFTETDWYVSYSLPTLVDGLDLFVGYTEYMYGGDSRDEELSLGAGYEVAGVGLGLTWYEAVGGGISGQTYVDLAAGYGIDISEELSASIDATLGFMVSQSTANEADGLEDGFNDWTLGASIGYAPTEAWSAGFTVTYIGQGDDTVLVDVDDGGTYDTEFVGMFSLACEM